MNEESIDILIDLLKIYKKYGGRAVAKARDLIKTKEIIPEIANILDEIPELNRILLNLRSQKHASYPMRAELNRSIRAPEKTAKNRMNSIPKELDKIKESFPSKYEVLKEVYSKLMTKELLPTQANIRNFAIENNISGVIGKERRSVIRSLMLFLIRSQTTMEDLNKLLKEMVKFTSNTDNSTLQRWADIIMRDKRKENDNHSKGSN